MTITIDPITPAIGAIVSGVDLAAPLEPEASEALKSALFDRQVLFFRNQQLNEVQHRDFAAHFGPLHIHPIYPRVPDVAEIIVLDTDLIDLADNAIWHSDISFAEIPSLGAVLVARQLPACGGDTLWASATAAYDALPQRLKDLVEGLTATHDIVKSFPVERFGADPAAYEQLERAKRNNPPVSHPIVRTHLPTGRKAIYVSEGFTTHIDGFDPDASASLLGLLFRHLARPEFSLRWRWQPGDVAMWDNRVTQHYATDDYRPHRRVMHRATMLGERPF